jgi:hypothetical protein
LGSEECRKKAISYLIFKKMKMKLPILLGRAFCGGG